MPTIEWFTGSHDRLADLFALADDSAKAAAVCREERRAALLVATGAADTRVLRLYQLLGFRLLRVERDAFTAESGHPAIEIDGIRLLDRVWLSLDLR
jgi:hypothetical protein